MIPKHPNATGHTTLASGEQPISGGRWNPNTWGWDFPPYTAATKYTGRELQDAQKGQRMSADGVVVMPPQVRKVHSVNGYDIYEKRNVYRSADGVLSYSAPHLIKVAPVAVGAPSNMSADATPITTFNMKPIYIGLAVVLVIATAFIVFKPKKAKA